MSKWLTIVGMGEDGYEGLGIPARAAIADAEIVVGSERLLDFLPPSAADRHVWPQPFSAVVDRIKPLSGRRTVILATGDPMNYGVARKLMTFIPFAEMTVIPHLSAFSHAAARVGWSIPDCDTLTLHGRDAANIEAFIQPDVRLFVLTADATTIPEVARRLVARGFGKSHITVLENMGGPRERQQSFIADACPPRPSPISTPSPCIASLRPAQKSGRASLAFPMTLSNMMANSPSARFAPQRLPPLLPPPINCCGTWAPAAAPSPSNGCGPRGAAKPWPSNQTPNASR